MKTPTEGVAGSPPSHGDIAVKYRIVYSNGLPYFSSVFGHIEQTVKTQIRLIKFFSVCNAVAMLRLTTFCSF